MLNDNVPSPLEIKSWMYKSLYLVTVLSSSAFACKKMMDSYQLAMFLFFNNLFSF